MKKRKKGVSQKEALRRRKQAENGLVSYRGDYKFTKVKGGWKVEDA